MHRDGLFIAQPRTSVCFSLTLSFIRCSVAGAWGRAPGPQQVLHKEGRKDESTLP